MQMLRPGGDLRLGKDMKAVRTTRTRAAVQQAAYGG